MSAKRKSSGKNNQADPNLESNKDVELERKVDAMMSVEQTAPPTPETDTLQTPEAPTVPDEKPEPAIQEEASSPEPTGAPLLPTEKLPDLESLPPEAEEPDAEIPPEPPNIIPPALPKPKSPADEPTRDVSDDLGLEDAGTGTAVDEIIAANSKESTTEPEHTSARKEPAFTKPKRNPIKRFFSSKFFRRSVVLLLLLGIGAAGAVPSSRYFALNTAGVRSASSATILDENTGQPLKNAEFSISGISAKTDEQGNARLNNLKLGPATIKITKPAFAEISRPVTVGWGSNPLGDFNLKAVGVQYKFKVTDFLSKKPIAKAEATSGEASAVSNDKGEIVLTVPQSAKAQAEVEIKAENYRVEKRTLASEQKSAAEVQLVPNKKHVFISKRSGTYDVYKVDVDGKNEEKVLAGNGSEQIETMSLSSHPTKNIAALISSRDNIRNKDGLNMSTLTIIDLNDDSSTKATQSERIQLIDWAGDKIVYVKVADGSKPDSVDRNRLISYDIDSQTEKELAGTNYFNDVVSAKGNIYYSPAAYNVNGSVGLFKIDVDGTGKKTLYDKEVWKMLRTSYDKLSVSMGEEWFELNLDNDALTRLDGSPAVQKTRLYSDGPGNGMSLWVDERDGKGVLLRYDQKTKNDKVTQSQSGLKNPVRWLSAKHVIFRVSNNQEIADYILNTDGGEARKIRDVTDTGGIDRWYYY